jgi:hypothetical protein
MNPHKHAEVIKAWADGATVQVFSQDDGLWATIESPFFWNEAHQYRIKPDLTAELAKAKRTLELAGYTDNGGELWKPPLGKSPDQRAARDLAIAEAVARYYASAWTPGIIKYLIARVKDTQ